MTTRIQALAAETGRLWVDITRADEIIIANKPGARVSDQIKSDIASIERFMTEASGRAHLIEDYMMLLKPEDIKDALILVNMAGSIAKDYSTSSDEAHSPEARHQMVSRVLAEATLLLENECGTTLKALGMEAFRGSDLWEDSLRKWHELLDRYSHLEKPK